MLLVVIMIDINTTPTPIDHRPLQLFKFSYLLPGNTKAQLYIQIQQQQQQQQPCFVCPHDLTSNALPSTYISSYDNIKNNSD